MSVTGLAKAQIALVVTTLLVLPVEAAASETTISQIARSAKASSFSSEVQDLARTLFHKQYLASTPRPNQHVSVAYFSALLATALEAPGKESVIPAQHEHWFYRYVASIAALFDWVLEYERRQGGSLAQRLHANALTPNLATLPVIPIDRESAAAIAFAAGFQHHVFRDELPPPLQPAPFADENEISGGPILRACHAAVYQGLIVVNLDNHFYPRRPLTWEELVRMIKTLKTYREQAEMSNWDKVITRLVSA